MIASTPNDFQRKSPQIHCNISEILTLHEELLLQIRRVIPDSELRSDHEGAGLPRSKHTRWHSVESCSAATGASPMQVARRSFEATWFGRSKRGVLISEPREVAEVAKVFGRLVGIFLGFLLLPSSLIFCAVLRWVVFLSMKSMVPSTNQ